MSRLRGRGRRWVAAVAALATVATLLVAAAGAKADPPPNPTDQQIQTAADQKAAIANEVGRLSARVAQLENQLHQLVAMQELAEQKLAFALSKLEEAKNNAAIAKAQVVVAQQQVDKARADFIGYVQASYMGGDVSGTAGTLLTAADPNVLLEQGTLQAYQSSHQLNAIGNMQRATVAKSNADAAARLAVQVQQDATAAAEVAKQQADAAVVAARQQEQAVQATLAQSQDALQSAQLELATLNNQRAKFIAYQKEQARIRAERERQRRLAAERAAAAARAAAAQRNSSGGGGVEVAPGPSGNWTPEAGQRAVQRAMRWLGTPYAWAGGNASGPTRGVCAGDGAFNDCNIVGFDCSGLVMYAWAQFPFYHYAATQYTQGSVHPDVSSLMPGDLVFWSSDGTIGGIHHVAIYIGGGQVIQAPQSGDIVRTTPLGDVSWGYFGATRPLT